MNWSALGKALALIESGDPYGGYVSVQGKLSALPMALREELVDNAWGGKERPLPRARIIAATGDPGAACQLIHADGKPTLGNPKADRLLLIAAGEASLARGATASSMRYFEAAAKHSKGSLAGDAQLGIARVATLRVQPAVAQRALTKALKLRLDHPRPALELSHLSDAPDASGKYLIEAGIHAARRLDVGHVRRHFPRASEFSVTHRGEAMRARATLESRTGRPAVALRSTCVCPWRPRRREVATRAISANSPSCKWHRATMLRRARLSIVQLPSIPTTESFLRNPPR